MTSEISKEEFHHLENLARLSEKSHPEQYRLPEVLDYMNRLQTVDTSKSSHALKANSTYLRPDQAAQDAQLDIFRERFLAQASLTEGKFVKVPKLR